jgi:hypothetical protein
LGVPQTSGADSHFCVFLETIHGVGLVIGSIELVGRGIDVLGDDYSYAVAFVNHRTDGYPYLKSITMAEIGLTNARGNDFQDLYNQNMYEASDVGPRLS